MKIPQQNKDLRRYVLRNDILRVFLYLSWVALWCFSAWFYNDRHRTYEEARKILGWKLFFLIAAAVISGFFIFRIWKFFTDRTFLGVIEGSDLSHAYSSSGDPTAIKGIRGSKSDFHLYTVLKVRLPNGKRMRIRFVQKDGFYLYYYNGQRILHFHGLPYPVRTQFDEDQGYLCAACGRIYKTHEPYCESCHHSLIDPRDLKVE